MILHAQTWPSRSRHFRFALLIGVFATALAVLVGVPTAATAQPNVRPVVKGVAEVGKTVTCATGKARVARVWWKRDGRKIKGATARRYRVIRKDAGAKLSCAATARGAKRAVASAPVVVTDAPTLITAPTVVGSPTVGSTLTCDPGTWTGNPTFAYSWTRDGSPAGVGNTYVVGAGETGAKIVCLVQGKNSAGASGYLQSARVIIGGGGGGGNETQAPTNTSPPVVVGNPYPGETLTCNPGTWTNNPTFAFSWTRNGSPAGTGPTYAVSAGDLGATIVCLAQGSNSAGASGYLQSAGVVVTNPPPPVLVYDATPTPLPGNVISYGFEATNFNEWGDEIQLAGGATHLDQATVVMSSWACETGSGATCATTPGATFQHPITLNIYAVDPLAATGVGALVTTVTVNQTIPYRPSASAGCTGGRWMHTDGVCYSGFANKIHFNLGGLTVPNTFIASIEYDTAHRGYNPTGVASPADSLNVGIWENPAVVVGSNVDPDAVFLSADSRTAPFKKEIDWFAYTPMMSFMGH